MRAIVRAIVDRGSEEAHAEHAGLGLSLISLQLLVTEPAPAYPRWTLTNALRQGLGSRRGISPEALILALSENYDILKVI